MSIMNRDFNPIRFIRNTESPMKKFISALLAVALVVLGLGLTDRIPTAQAAASVSVTNYESSLSCTKSVFVSWSVDEAEGRIDYITYDANNNVVRQQAEFSEGQTGTGVRFVFQFSNEEKVQFLVYGKVSGSWSYRTQTTYTRPTPTDCSQWHNITVTQAASPSPCATRRYNISWSLNIPPGTSGTGGVYYRRWNSAHSAVQSEGSLGEQNSGSNYICSGANDVVEVWGYRNDTLPYATVTRQQVRP